MAPCSGVPWRGVGARVLLLLLAAASFSAVGAGNDWLSHNNDRESAYSPLTQITVSNVRRLRLSWFLDLPGEQMLQHAFRDEGELKTAPLVCIHGAGSSSVIWIFAH